MAMTTATGFVGRGLLTSASASILLSFALACPAAAADQPAAAPAAPTGEIVVIARERQEALQNVPSQVTAFTAQTIKDKGIEMPRDYIQAVPNVTLVETQNAGTSFVVIRGISQARNSEPSVAVVVDGVPETQPAQFNQELVDIQQIEVLKGPQGALYGRNAIGGAIIITTQAPTAQWEGHAVAGYESGPGGKGEAVVSGPLTSTLGMRAAVSYVNSSGHIENTFLHSKADPVSDLTGRLRFLWKPNEKATVDVRLSADRLWTQALYYNIVYYSPFFQPPGNKLTVPDVNNVSLPVRVNNPGKNNRAIYDASVKMDFQFDAGTFSSISGVNLTKEILTGDAFDFLPINDSILHTFAGFDQNQSQFLRVRTLTQELRFTSPADQRVRWIAGAQAFLTSRFISTGNEWDTGHGVVPTFYTPTTPGPEFPLFSASPNPQASFLSDGQDNTALGVYVATSTDITKQIELSLNMRYDIDKRRNTTLTPQTFLDAFGIPATTGQRRDAAFHAWQPQAILKYRPTEELMIYGSYSRGFRSGGFNQTGVATAAAAAGFVGVGDIFKAETADTWEGGLKARLFDHRVTFNASGYTTLSKNGYFFVFLASNSTQNLGNIPKVRYTGFDIDATAHVTMDVDVSAGFGYTDSSVKEYYHKDAPQYDFRLGEPAPLVAKYTFNASGQWRPRLTDKLNALVRLDYNLIGPTYFWESDPNVAFAGSPPITKRKVVGLVDARLGVEASDWSLVFWAKNLNNHIYNAEYSPGGFVFKAEPRRWGVDLTKRF
jgi:iron complex outermembrane receptor protein